RIMKRCGGIDALSVAPDQMALVTSAIGKCVMGPAMHVEVFQFIMSADIGSKVSHHFKRAAGAAGIPVKICEFEVVENHVADRRKQHHHLTYGTVDAAEIQDGP